MKSEEPKGWEALPQWCKIGIALTAALISFFLFLLLAYWYIFTIILHPGAFG